MNVTRYFTTNEQRNCVVNRQLRAATVADVNDTTVCLLRLRTSTDAAIVVTVYRMLQTIMIIDCYVRLLINIL